MSNNNIKTDICFLGGDKRQLFAAIEFASRVDGNVFVSGETFLDISRRRHRDNIFYEENPLRALHAASAVILPLPAAKVEKVVSLVDVIRAMKRKGGAILGGKFSPYMLDILEDENVKYVDYFSDESFTITNAYITAEGAVVLAAEHLDIMLRDARCAILGFGRIGMALGRILTSIGCKASVYARREEVRTLAREMGLCAMNDPELSDFDVIFNTVPERIISNNTLLELPEGKIFIELASAPGGFDPDIAKQCSQTVVDGGGLPGKYAPQSAGLAVAEAICSAIKRICPCK